MRLFVAADQVRRLVIWSHVVFGTVTLFIYLSTLDLTHFAYWSPRASERLLLMGAPVLLPYAISAGHCWRLYTWQGSGPSHARVVAFIALLITGAVLVDATILGAFGHVEGMDFFQILVLQAGAYLWGGEWILNVI